MRTDDFRPSDNVEDDRQASASRGGMIGFVGCRSRVADLASPESEF